MIKVGEKIKQNKDLLKKISWKTLDSFSSKGFDFLLYFIISTTLLSSDFGIYIYILSIITLISIFSQFGIKGAIIRYISENIDDKKEISYIMTGALVFVTTISIIVSCILFGLKWLNLSFINEENLLLILYSTPLFFLFGVKGIYEGYIISLEKFKQLFIIKVITYIFILFITYFLVSSFAIIGAILSKIFLALLFLLFSYFIFFRKFQYNFNFSRTKDLLNYSFVLGMVSIIYFFYTRVDIWFLQYFGYISEIAHYDIILKFLDIFFIFSIILGEVLGPKIIKLRKKDFGEKIRKLYLKIGIGIIIFYTIGIFLLKILFSILLPILYPNYNIIIFKEIYNYVVLLLPIIGFGIYSAAAFLNPLGYAKITLYVTLIASIFNLVLNYVFIKIYGFIGVIIITVIIQYISIIIEHSIFYFKFLRKIDNDQKTYNLNS